MNKSVPIGQIIGAGVLKLDIQRLIETGMLVTASSGGGKSMTLRTILETTHGHIPQIVLDVEGEFASLREKFDYLLIGKGGDLPADPRTAALLARKLLELNASAIIDLLELKHHEKHEFMRLFLEALIDSPRELWGPRLLVIDEAHQFCPEKGSGASEAWEAVIDCCEKGRKRGIRPVMATQRLSKLHKDAAAECQNKVIGLGNLDIDRERSAKELGFTHKEDILSLRDLDPGEFYVVGPALSRQVVKVKIDEASTSHPKVRNRAIKVPAATARVKGLLEKLKDLPQQAAQELKTVADFKARIRELEAKVREIPKPEKIVEKVDVDAIRKDLARVYQASVKQWQVHVVNRIKNLTQEAFQEAWIPPIPSTDLDIKLVKMPNTPIPSNLGPGKIIPLPSIPNSFALGKGEQEILKFLNLQPARSFTKIQIGAMTGYAGTSGTFNTYMSRLKGLGFVLPLNGGFKISPEGSEIAVSLPGEAAGGRRALESWLQRLGGGPARIYEVLLRSQPAWVLKTDLGDKTGLSPTSGTFNTYVSKLITLGLIRKEGDALRLNPDILDL